MSVYRVTKDFLNGASILETRQELMRLGWSAERANGWLLKSMRFATSAKSEKPMVVSGVRDASRTSGATVKSGHQPSDQLRQSPVPSAKRGLLQQERSDVRGVTSIAGELEEKDPSTWYAESGRQRISQLVTE